MRLRFMCQTPCVKGCNYNGFVLAFTVKMNVHVNGISRVFGATEVLRNFSLEVFDREFVSLLGPSGVGKTTLLRILAGLDAPDSGSVRFSGRGGAEVSAGGAAVLVFQDYVLFPFLTIYGNVAFGLQARKLPRAAVAARVAELLEHFGLADQAKQYPTQLSAGQRQRVAIARALAVEPRVLLLDEPLANLDKNLKRDTALYLRRVQREFGITTICVTHDQEEAMAISDRIAVMLDGGVAQFGSPQDVYYRSVSPSVARFLGPVSELPHDLVEPGGAGHNGGTGNRLFRPEQLIIIRRRSGRFVVRDVRLLGPYRLCVLECGGNSYEVFTAYPVQLEQGDSVELCRPEALAQSKDEEGVYDTPV